MSRIQVEAPSNIALIKYMGKTNASSNIPTNASLSYTVNYLQTKLEITENNIDEWQLLEGYYPLHLSEKGIHKYLQFFKACKERLQIRGNFLLRSANTFPADAGLASSASSFAALTKACWALCQLQHGERALSILYGEQRGDIDLELAKISRTGSGSSCRSFLPGFVKWEGTEVSAVVLPYPRLFHMVFLLEERKKVVSSSEAHLRVTTSPQFVGRVERAEQRLEALTVSLQSKDWLTARKIVWDEFIDMHQLFETSQPGFSFWNVECKDLLVHLEQKFLQEKNGPLVTMDAGPNVHLFFNEEQIEMAKQYKKEFGNYKILTNI